MGPAEGQQKFENVRLQLRRVKITIQTGSVVRSRETGCNGKHASVIVVRSKSVIPLSEAKSKRRPDRTCRISLKFKTLARARRGCYSRADIKMPSPVFHSPFGNADSPDSNLARPINPRARVVGSVDVLAAVPTTLLKSMR